MNSITLFHFNENSNINEWKIVDDGVMGGTSNGNIKLSLEGNGVFYGNISLENNGGFSSVRHTFKKVNTVGFSHAVIKLKGDGKDYQFRLKKNAEDAHSYIYPFSTTGAWQEIRIPLEDMYPVFRGRKLDMPNFTNQPIEEITFLIGNKKNESFTLELSSIILQ